MPALRRASPAGTRSSIFARSSGVRAPPTGPYRPRGPSGGPRCDGPRIAGDGGELAPRFRFDRGRVPLHPVGPGGPLAEPSPSLKNSTRLAVASSAASADRLTSPVTVASGKGAVSRTDGGSRSRPSAQRLSGEGKGRSPIIGTGGRAERIGLLLTSPQDMLYFSYIRAGELVGPE